MQASLGKLLLQALINELEVEGKRILQECVNERTYEHRTHNLYDSYGYGVYVEGKLVRSGYLSAAPEATVKKNWYGAELAGRDEIQKFLASAKTNASTIELIVAAAMPYGEILETGGGKLKKSYKVISMAYDKLAALSTHYKGSRVRALTGGKI